MENLKAVVICVTIILILSGVLGFLYYKFELPRKEKENYLNLHLLANFKNNPIRTGYEIELEDRTILQGNTSKSYELIKISPGIIKIRNINIENQNFYIEEKIVNLSKNNTRIDVRLNEQKPVKVDVYKNDSYFVNVFSEYFKDVDFCIDYSYNFMFVEAINFTEINKEGFEEYECYRGDFSLIDNNKTIEISFNKNNYQEDEFMSLFLIDSLGNQKIVKVK